MLYIHILDETTELSSTAIASHEVAAPAPAPDCPNNLKIDKLVNSLAMLGDFAEYEKVLQYRVLHYVLDCVVGRQTSFAHRVLNREKFYWRYSTSLYVNKCLQVIKSPSFHVPSNYVLNTNHIFLGGGGQSEPCETKTCENCPREAAKQIKVFFSGQATKGGGG